VRIARILSIEKCSRLWGWGDLVSIIIIILSYSNYFIYLQIHRWTSWVWRRKRSNRVTASNGSWPTSWAKPISKMETTTTTSRKWRRRRERGGCRQRRQLENRLRPLYTSNHICTNLLLFNNTIQCKWWNAIILLFFFFLNLKVNKHKRLCINLIYYYIPCAIRKVDWKEKHVSP